MRLFTRIFPHDSRDAKRIDASLTELKKVLRKTLKETVDVDEHLWTPESHMPQSRPDAKIIPYLVRNSRKLSNSLKNLDTQQRNIDDLFRRHFTRPKGSVPRAYVLVMHMFYGLQAELRLVQESLAIEMKDIKAALELLKESSGKGPMLERLHSVIDDYHERDEKLQEQFKELYHRIAKIEYYSTNYMRIAQTENYREG